MSTIVGGIDAGSYSTKAVLLGDGEILAYSTVVAGMGSVSDASRAALAEAMTSAGIARSDVSRFVVTGSAGRFVSLGGEGALEVACMARGVAFHKHTIRNVLDVGAEHCVAVQCLDGQALTVARTDACAAGAGIFLQVVAELLELPLEEMGRMALESEEAVEIVSRCAVFAESEIISLLHAGTSPEAVLRGVYQGLALRLHPLLLQTGLRGEVALIGGGAQDVGLVAAVEERLGAPVFIPPGPSTVTALGAALIAGDQVA